MITFHQFCKEFLIFTLNQARASVFGGALLLLMIATMFLPERFPVHRYDIIFVGALCLQLFLIATKHESRSEAKIIFLFHIVATIMELFKTHPSIGSWRYPTHEDALFVLGTVPLFTGFLYSSVGSYIARAWRIFQFHFTCFPPFWTVALLALCIYINFFAHHFLWDLRALLLLWTVLLFWRTRIYFTMVKTPRSMPLLVSCGLATFFVYLAENIGTLTRVWLYPSQEVRWQLVPLSKYSSWFLLMIVSFALVALIYRKTLAQKQR